MIRDQKVKCPLQHNVVSVTREAVMVKRQLYIMLHVNKCYTNTRHFILFCDVDTLALGVSMVILMKKNTYLSG